MDSYDSVELLKSPLVAIMHASHPLAGKAVVSCPELKGEVVHLLDAEPFKDTSTYIRELLRENGLSSRFIWHTWSTYDEAFSLDFSEGVYISASEAVAAYSITSELEGYRLWATINVCK